MEVAFRKMGDDIGPCAVWLVREPRVGLEGFVVVDNIACGPALGGVRLAPDVTVNEVSRLARAMTFKNASAGLPHGGAKAGIVAPVDLDPLRREAIVRAFARAIRPIDSYVPGPDMGTDETCMAWIHDEIGRAAGLPRAIGGIPLDEIGATGFGLAVCASIAAPFAGFELRGARVAIEGFGAVGMHAARFLAMRGARIVAVSDSHGATARAEGLDVDALVAFKRSRRPLAEFAGGTSIARDDLVGVAAEIWLPAARPDTLRADNVSRLRANLVLQGANIPATREAEKWLHEHGIVAVPDFIANAGGVICASVEYRGGLESQAFATIEERITTNTREVLEQSRAAHKSPREVAETRARERVLAAMKYRRP